VVFSFIQSHDDVHGHDDHPLFHGQENVSAHGHDCAYDRVLYEIIKIYHVPENN